MEQFLKIFQNFKGHFAISEISPVIWGISEAIEIILETLWGFFKTLFNKISKHFFILLQFIKDTVKQTTGF